MYFKQSIKMAGKSLWTNKLRSFLTMLGIIIGVLTVALLTSVASGVSDAVVSNIRSQSTLAIYMDNKKQTPYENLNNVLSSNQHSKEDDDYYDYSLNALETMLIARDLSGINNVDEDFVQDYLFVNSLLDNIQVSPEDEENYKLYLMLKASNQKDKIATSGSVNAVSENFKDIYEFDIIGEFPKNNSEAIVDKEFLSYYLEITDESKYEEAIGQKFSIGVDNYTSMLIKFNIDISEQLIDDIKTYMLSIGLVIRNIDTSTPKQLTLELNAFSVYSNDNLKDKIQNDKFNFDNVETDFSSVLQDEIEIEDIYDISNVKTFTISGIFEDSNSIMGTSTFSSNEKDNDLSIIDMFTMHNKGVCYILLDDENAKTISLGKYELKNEIPVAYAYLRFKTENVMDKRINDLTLTLITNGKKPIIDFMLISMSSVANIISTIMGILTKMLTVISIVSLIVGGIGIMNIMLVAVSERTREIGIRKAIGAKKSSILIQFLIEALMLSLLGGAIGLGLSAIGCLIIGNVMGISIIMPLWVILMSLGFCTFIGIVFGMYPAIKASKMLPIDALRRD